MNEKLSALKTLGFNYITRDKDNRLIAWMNRPQRFILCAKRKKDEMLKKYGEETILNYYDPENEEEENCMRHGSFVFSRIEPRLDLWDYDRILLYDPNNDFKDIAWDNSPFKIP